MDDKIKRLRERKVLGQAELAKTAGVSVRTLWRIENKTLKPRPSTIRKIASALGVPAEDLVSEPEQGEG